MIDSLRKISNIGSITEKGRWDNEILCIDFRI